MNPNEPIDLAELIRRSIANYHDLTVFERIRYLNDELARLGIKRSEDDHPVRKIIGALRRRPGF
jgi:hypothetical protein